MDSKQIAKLIKDQWPKRTSDWQDGDLLTWQWLSCGERMSYESVTGFRREAFRGR